MSLFDNLLDENDLSIGLLEKQFYPHLHLLITGWYTKNEDESTVEIGGVTFDDFNYNCYSKNLYSKNGNFFCLDYGFDSNYDINIDKTFIDSCLNIFDNYINVALVYREKDGKTVYYYQSFFQRKSQKKVEELQEKMNDLINEYEEKKKKAEQYNQLSQDIVKQFVCPGIFNVESCDIDKDVIAYLQQPLDDNDIWSFFSDIPLKEQAFSLYWHPQKCFPLPILLRDNMPSLEDLWKMSEWPSWLEVEDKEKFCNIRPNVPSHLNGTNGPQAILLMGYYSSSEEFGCKGPHVVLCPKNINDYCSSFNFNKQLGYLIVLIHELAHAMMDKYKSKNSLNSIFARAMEESLANMVTLQWFEKYNNENIKNVEHFIEKQPDIYKFGIEQYKARVDWPLWRDSYKNMHYQLWDWYNTCFKKKVKINTVLNAYNLVFKLNYEDLLKLLKKSVAQELTKGSSKSYISYINNINKLSGHETTNWLYYCLRHKSGEQALDYIETKLNSLQNIGSKEKAGFRKFASYTLGFYDATIQLQSNDKVFCALVMKNALFPSKDVVEKVKNGALGSEENIKNKGNIYASWDYMTHARKTGCKKNSTFQDPSTYQSLINKGYNVNIDIKADDNTIANQAIKKAIIESYKGYPVIPEWSLFKDYEVCHVWDKPTDRRYYASIVNLILLPRALAKLTDHNNAVKELLHYEVFKRFGFKPEGEGNPSKPTCYSEREWRDYGLVENNNR